MNIFSLNIRGGGSRVKRRIIGNIVKKGKANICFLQETKIYVLDDLLTASFWDIKYVEWSANGASRTAGGLVILWKTDLLTLNYNFKGERFVGVNAYWKGLNYFLFMNVYSPRNLEGKRRLWCNLNELKRKTGDGIG